MPIHDWSRGDDSLFHDFQLGWASGLAGRLNCGILPSSHFAMTETIELRPAVGFLRMEEPERPFKDAGHKGDTHDIDTENPLARFVIIDDQKQYACVVITIRHAAHHQPVAAILWVTRQDKQTPYRLRSILRTAVGAITHRIHLLVVDLFPPTPRDPQGIHKAIWDEFGDEPFEALLTSRLLSRLMLAETFRLPTSNQSGSATRCRRCRFFFRKPAISRLHSKRLISRPGRSSRQCSRKSSTRQ